MNRSHSQAVAGIHLSGPNAHKTSVVIMTGRFSDGNLKITHLFEKIGGVGRLFSDERIFEIVREFRPETIFVDCPLTEPPCVSCVRPKCPGVDGCEDLGVAYMQYLVNDSSRKRKRPINPQTQRLWDVNLWSLDRYALQDPCYSANLAPLVARAKTLQRRLRSLDEALTLRETHIHLALKHLNDRLGAYQDDVLGYRSFGIGKGCRGRLVERFFANKWDDLNHLDECASSVENFHAFIAAFVGALDLDKMTTQPPNALFSEQGWVCLPSLP